MKYLSIISSIIILFSCNSGNNQVEKNPLVLDFPSISTFADSVIYFGCEDILSKTPQSVNFSIYEDTIIPLHQFDNRLDLKLKFNWLYEEGYDNWPNTIGVSSIDMLKNDKIISSIDLKEIIEVEAFMDNDPESKRFMQPVRDDIYMQDVNFDSYLDIKIRSVCGKGCYYSYWIFNPIKNEFEKDDSLDAMRPYYYDCKNNLIYSYPGGTGWYYDIFAYKVTNGKMKMNQSVYYEFNEKYNLEIYRDSAYNIIFSDTIYNN
jgi:hypothetical protein